MVGGLARRRVGRDPAVPSGCYGPTLGLSVPYFWAVVAAGGSSCLANFGGPWSGCETDPGARNLHPRLCPVKRVAKIGGGGVVATPHRPSYYGSSVGCYGHLFPNPLSQKGGLISRRFGESRGELRYGSEMRNYLASTPSRRDSQFGSNSASNWPRMRRIVAIAPLDAATFSVSTCAAIISAPIDLIYVSGIFRRAAYWP